MNSNFNSLIGSQKYTRNLILRLICGIYLIAFLSIYHQAPGLFGRNGLSPLHIQSDTLVSETKAAQFHKKFFFSQLPKGLNVEPEYSIDIICLVGAFISFVSFTSGKYLQILTFTTLWFLYLLIADVLGAFHDQFDDLLVEAGFICLILAPFFANDKRYKATDVIGLLLLKWLIFRFFIQSGSIKILSRCPQWWNFKAIEYYFETMPLPNIISYYCHFLPKLFLKITNLFVFVAELILPWFLFISSRSIQQSVFYLMSFLQWFILLTGNCGPTNYLLLILLLSVLDDEFFLSSDFRLSKAILLAGKQVLTVFSIIAFAVYVDATVYPWLKINERMFEVLLTSIRSAPMMMLILLICTFFTNVISQRMMTYTKNFFQKMYVINTMISFTFLGIFMVLASMVPLGNVAKSTTITNPDVQLIYKNLQSFHIVNEYGKQFRQMRTERMEIMYEYANRIEGPWTEYGFRYKPWKSSSSSITGPFLPRLDYNLYFAASSSYTNQLWTVALSLRLLEKEPTVLKLLDIKTNSDSRSPPKYVRATKHKFVYSPMQNKNQYWTKSYRSEYVPAFTLNDTNLNYYTKNFLRNDRTSSSLNGENNLLLQKVLDLLRKFVSTLDGCYFIAIVFMAAFVIMFFKHK